MSRLTHLDEQGAARMVDVGGKTETAREAVAGGRITMSAEARDAIAAGAVAKGDVLAVARIAGIMAAKRTSDLIPLCHPLPLSKVTLDLSIEDDGVSAQAIVATNGRTGVEMEALTAVSTALLTVYDMAKALDKRMTIGNIRLLKKTGGKSGDFVA
ncbi:cyclic pyranopterin monophosphate synthase MoaC [Sphingomonas sp. ABOLG]|jgi:cyclic pyranopterin phosphate synthase|uniref:cyclic pyranopterin monophosphate synthase MoaC n=1 Tax=Sphingomonas sp. ABOLG TaxID=1985880 RepID=UPI000F7F6472|nr:cyclic pyranopterin monophosphate synthase MoaC [Sphingomonas sp. ABOLG]RSV15590.1 cyclic pyranopterin monophosphate synthase MoaC [Sphingomonas sp. ABOLG]